MKLTDSGREVRGGDGITPDVVYDPPKLNPFQEAMARRDVIYPFKDGVGDFTRFYLGEKPQITKDFTVDDAVIKQFKTFLDKEHISYTDSDIQANLPWLQWHIQREIFTSTFGINEGNKIDLRADPEVAKAEELFPQARALYDNARKVMAEKQSTQSPIQP